MVVVLSKDEHPVVYQAIGDSRQDKVLSAPSELLLVEFSALNNRVTNLHNKSITAGIMIKAELDSAETYSSTKEKDLYDAFKTDFDEAATIVSDMKALLSRTMGGKGMPVSSFLGQSLSSSIEDSIITRVSYGLCKEAYLLLTLVVQVCKAGGAKDDAAQQGCGKRAKELFLLGTKLLFDNFRNHPDIRPYQGQLSSSTAREIEAKHGESFIDLESSNPITVVLPTDNSSPGKGEQSPTEEGRVHQVLDSLLLSNSAAKLHAYSLGKGQAKFRAVRRELEELGVSFSLTERQCKARALPKSAM